MPDRVSEHINAQLREQLRGYSPDDAVSINRALREAAGRPVAEPPPQPPPRAELLALGGSDYTLKDEEPLPTDPDEWERFIYRKRVVRLLDQAGRLPGEPGYSREATGPADRDRFDLAAAITNRRRRWQARGL